MRWFASLTMTDAHHDGRSRRPLGEAVAVFFHEGVVFTMRYSPYPHVPRVKQHGARWLA